MPVLQDDDYLVCLSGHRQEGLDCHLGPEGRLLACADKRIISQHPRIPGGRLSLSLQSDAVRAEHRLSSLHQARICPNKGVARQGRKDLCLPRRLDPLGVKPSEVPSGLREGPQRDTEVWIPSQREEVDADSVPTSQVARFDLGHYRRYLGSSLGLSKQGEVCGERLPGKEICHEKATATGSGSP